MGLLAVRRVAGMQGLGAEGWGGGNWRLSRFFSQLEAPAADAVLPSSAAIWSTVLGNRHDGGFVEAAIAAVG